MSRNRSGSLIEDLVGEMKEISTGKDRFGLRFIRPKKKHSETPKQAKKRNKPSIVDAIFADDKDIVASIEQPDLAKDGQRVFKTLDEEGQWSETIVEEHPPRCCTAEEAIISAQRIARDMMKQVPGFASWKETRYLNEERKEVLEDCPRHPIQGRGHYWVQSRATKDHGRWFCDFCGIPNKDLDR